MRFVAGIDYGPRKGTLGFAVHMAEGGDGTLPYLARRAGETDAQWRTRVRGVSANFVILSTGEIVQMVPWAHASGSMNPADRSDTTGFYRTQVIQAVLGAHYVDPNAWSLSVEITGFRNVGPNSQQVEALVRLVDMARARYPGMVGAYGHADQTDTKGCPGTAPSMLAAWARIGHGPFPLEAPVRNFAYVYAPDGRLITGTLTVKTDVPHWYLRLVDGKLVAINAATFGTKQAVKVKLTEDISPGVGDRRTGWLIGDKAAFVLATDVDFVPYPGKSYPVTVGGKPAGSVTLP